MGEVYKARDTRLDREVAIKVAAERFSQRFESEAYAIAALNHPHICAAHDVGPNFLVMEYVEGETLADRIRKGPFSLDTTSSPATLCSERKLLLARGVYRGRPNSLP